MKNNKAPGKDNIPIELIKYAPRSIHKEIYIAINNIYEKHEEVDTEGILVPLPKPPPKPEGTSKNLRPITSNVFRKILSRMVTERIKPKLNEHLPQSQSAYRNGRSTTDIVWAYRWIIAKIQEYQMKINMNIGIDMSSAFNTIERQKLMEVVEEILDED